VVVVLEVGVSIKAKRWVSQQAVGAGTGISVISRKKVCEVEQKVRGPPPAGQDHKPMLGSGSRRDEQCSDLRPLDRGTCGEKCWGGKAKKAKGNIAAISAIAWT